MEYVNQRCCLGKSLFDEYPRDKLIAEQSFFSIIQKKKDFQDQISYKSCMHNYFQLYIIML